MSSKRPIITTFVVVLMCAIFSFIGIEASAQTSTDYVEVVGFNESTDYSYLISKAISSNNKYGIEMLPLYEQQRNLKIEVLCLPYSKTYKYSSEVAIDTGSVNASEEYFVVTGCDLDVDYSAAIKECLKDGSIFAFDVGRILEQKRNMKIQSIGEDVAYEKWGAYVDTTFANATTIDDVKVALGDKPSEDTSELVPMEPEVVGPVFVLTDYEKSLLYKMTFCELGCDWVPDWAMQATVSVMLNRLNSSYYPNTVEGVLSQSGQYSPWNSSWFWNCNPTEKVKRNVDYVIQNGVTIPANVIGQSGYPQGPIYAQYTDSVLGTTVYFTCG